MTNTSAASTQNPFARDNRATLHTEEIKGKTAIVTGANAGIGAYVAKALAQQGVRVVMACRSLERANAAKQNIIKEIGSQAEPLLVPLLLDLAQPKSVVEFVGQFRELQLPSLDILICNAAIASQVDDELKSDAPEGIEKVFGTNVLGHFLLIELLMPELTRSKGNVTITSSGVHYSTDFTKGTETLPVADMAFVSRFRQSMASLELDGQGAAGATYSYSKLANLWNMFALHGKYHKTTGVAFTASNPSLTTSELRRDMLDNPWEHLAIPTENGSQSCIHIANIIDRSISGVYFDDCEDHTHDRVNDEAKKPERWTELYEFCRAQLKEYL